MEIDYTPAEGLSKEALLEFVASERENMEHFKAGFIARGIERQWKSIGTLETPSDLNTLNQDELREVLTSLRIRVASLRSNALSRSLTRFDKPSERYYLNALRDLDTVSEKIILDGFRVSLISQAQKAVETCLRIQYNYKAKLAEGEVWPDSFDPKAYMQKFLTNLKEKDYELFKVWVVLLTFDHGPYREEEILVDTLKDVSDAKIKAMRSIVGPEALIHTTHGWATPRFFWFMEIPRHEKYFKIPMAALSFYGFRGDRDFTEVTGLSDIDIETIVTLHGGAAYPLLEDAKEAAFNLSE